MKGSKDPKWTTLVIWAILEEIDPRDEDTSFNIPEVERQAMRSLQDRAQLRRRMNDLAIRSLYEGDGCSFD